jgi:nucleoside-diphosphate-sugar epimerase
MDTVLVTGGTGHLGRDIVPQLQQRNYRVRILARTPGQDPAIDWIRGIWPPAKASPRPPRPAPRTSCTCLSSACRPRGFPTRG